MNLDLARDKLERFDFNGLFVEVLGWGQPTLRRPIEGEIRAFGYSARMVAELAGAAIFVVRCGAGIPERTVRDAIERDVARQFRENVCIFLDDEKRPTQSFWVWANRDRGPDNKPRRSLREHTYFAGQPADLFLSKLQALVFELADFAEGGNLTVVEVAQRLRESLDVERVTRRFYSAYADEHARFVEYIEGIDNERDRRWYASVMLNRLMFVWFMQKKFFLDGGNANYLTDKLAESGRRGKDRFFEEFLAALFFEAFAQPEASRSPQARALTGTIPYLNGGLFIPHPLETEADRRTLRIGRTLRIADVAFENLFALFARFSWNLDDTPGGKADEINPDVLGYIFEKYINQKAFGAYYTRTEITGYLCEHVIHGLILDRMCQPAFMGEPAVEFDSVPELLSRMDARMARRLADEVLPSLRLLDPAVGSGAFLVAAMKVLINIYSAIVGRAKLGADRELRNWLAHIEARHANVGYHIKRRIITDNLFGVDVMEEAAEIAKLRLFLALVASARSVVELEPLPNIDFNIMAGNSLLGLVHVDPDEFDGARRQQTLFGEDFKTLVERRNREVSVYCGFGERESTRALPLADVKRGIDQLNAEARPRLDELLREDFDRLGVRFEEPAWDTAAGKPGRSRKRAVTVEDLRRDRPFHWGFEFSEIIERHGGFDGIITNPPWEIFKPQDKEFFDEYSEVVTKNKMTIKAFEKERDRLLRKREVRAAYLDYLARFPHLSAYFRAAPEYRWQSAEVGGKKTGSDLNLYKLFVERCFHLLRFDRQRGTGGRCGIVIPSGIYTDLGAKGLRDLLFGHTRIEGLFGFENRKNIFEGVHRSFKFVVLTFEKREPPRLLQHGERNASAPPDDLLAPTQAGEQGTRAFPAAFMRHDVADLARFPQAGAITIDVALVRKLSPDSHSVMEFKSELDVLIAQKMLRFPLLGERIDGAWNLKLTREFDMTNDSALFKTAPGPGRLPLYEGKMIWQFDHRLAAPRYWVDEGEGQDALLGSVKRRLKAAIREAAELNGAELDEYVESFVFRYDYTRCRLAFRDIAASTNERTLVCSIVPPNRFAGNTLNLQTATDFVWANGNCEQRLLMTNADQLVCCALLNSFAVDWMLRQKVTSHVNMFYAYQLPLPRLDGNAAEAVPLIDRAARLICTAPEFDALAAEVGLGDHTAGVTDPAERARLRAELDGLVAHLYGLTEEEFAHILSTFPLVDEAVKVAARNAYRDVARGLIQ